MLSAGLAEPAAAAGPTRCGTVALLQSLREAPGGPLPATRPAAGIFEEELDPEGRFLLRWPLRGPRREESQGLVADVAHTLDAAWRILVGHGGWPDPSAAGPVEFTLLTTEPSRTIPLEDPLSGPDEGVSVAVIVGGASAGWPAEALHQLLHVLQLSRSSREGLWAYESGALALEDRLLGGGSLSAGLMARRQATPERSLTSSEPELMAGAAPFLAWLAAHRGDGLLSLWWERSAREWEDNSLAALDSALRLRDATTLAEAWRAWTVWSAYPDPALRPVGADAALARAMPSSRAARVVRELPAEGLGGSALELQPMGYGVIRLLDMEAVGAVRVELEAESGPSVQADALVSWPHVEGGWLAVPFVFSQGRAVLSIPVGPGTEVALVVRHGGTGGDSQSVAWRADADPTFPYELSDLAAEAAPGRMDLTWGSASERGLFGWLVYRADSPQGPFRPLCRFPLPALGESDGPLSYHWADSAVEPGRLYYYLVEGITVDGLARRSPVVTRRSAPDGGGNGS